MDDHEWKVVCNSEVFREFAKEELAKEERAKMAKASDESNSEALFDEFKQLELRINGNDKVKTAFREFKERLMRDPEFLKKADQQLAEIVMMLDLGD